jgi:hypothetical protein
MVDVKDLRPYVMRLFPSARRRLAKLPATRKALKAELRAMVKKIGPSMGKLQIPFHAANLTKKSHQAVLSAADIYYEKDLDWQKIQLETKNMSSQDLEHFDSKKNE